MKAFFPKEEKEIENTVNMFSQILVDVGTEIGMNINLEKANEETQKILTETGLFLEPRAKKNLQQFCNESIFTEKETEGKV